MTQTDRTSQGVSRLSERAQALGLYSDAEVQAEYDAAKEGWSKGHLYHCAWCDVDFASASGARKHMRTHRHVVLRLCWYDDSILRPEHKTLRDATLHLGRPHRFGNRAPDPDIAAVARSS